MSEVIVLNGPPGVGKARVAAALRASRPGSVAISGAALRAFAPLDVRAHLGGGATYRVAGALVKAYLELGAACVIFDYVFSRPAHFRYFSEALPASAKPEVFTLWACLETVVARNVGRPEQPHGGPDVADIYREMQLNQSLMGRIVWHESGDPELAAAQIRELAGWRSVASVS